MTPRKVAPACPKPCAACPWRRSNQGKRHPGGWYTKANLRRLWNKLRGGERMTCHPTDPDNPVPTGREPVPEDAVTHECCGALILQQREFMALQSRLAAPGADAKSAMKQYRKDQPRGLTREGVMVLLNRALFGSVEGSTMTRPDLSDPDVYYEVLAQQPPASSAVDASGEDLP